MDCKDLDWDIVERIYSSIDVVLAPSFTALNEEGEAGMALMLSLATVLAHMCHESGCNTEWMLEDVFDNLADVVYERLDELEE